MSRKKTSASVFDPQLSPDEIKKYWARAVISDQGCWGWTGAKTPFGYGFFTRFKKVDGQYAKKTMYAHRASYQIHYGLPPDGAVVMHSCDNPGCSNPEHLSAGSHQDNVDDMIRKGRHPNILKPVVLYRE